MSDCCGPNERRGKPRPMNRGRDGDSAYEVWRKAQPDGSPSSMDDYLESMQGRDGQSAYELWLSMGNIGTEEQFLASLRGGQSTTTPTETTPKVYFWQRSMTQATTGALSWDTTSEANAELAGKTVLVTVGLRFQGLGTNTTAVVIPSVAGINLPSMIVNTEVVGIYGVVAAGQYCYIDSGGRLRFTLWSENIPSSTTVTAELKIEVIDPYWMDGTPVVV